MPSGVKDLAQGDRVWVQNVRTKQWGLEIFEVGRCFFEPTGTLRLWWTYQEYEAGPRLLRLTKEDGDTHRVPAATVQVERANVGVVDDMTSLPFING
jgi:hypothetical protein